jgi:hypothetical protein
MPFELLLRAFYFLHAYVDMFSLINEMMLMNIGMIKVSSFMLHIKKNNNNNKEPFKELEKGRGLRF